MNIKNYVYLSIIVLSLPMFGQGKIQLILPQNIITKGENIQFILSATDQNTPKIAVNIDVLFANNLQIISQNHVFAIPSPKVYDIDLTNLKEEGSYIINAYILELGQNKILESHSYIFHQIDEGISNQFYAFKNKEIKYVDNANITFSKLNKRQLIQNQNDAQIIQYAIDEKYSYKTTHHSLILSGEVDTVHRFYFGDKSVNNIYACYPNSKTSKKLTQTVDNSYLTISSNEDNFYLFDIFNAQKVELQPNKIDYAKIVTDLVLLDKVDIDFINALSPSASLTKKISYLVDESVVNNKKSSSLEIKSDNFYELSQYPEFESIPLFLKEVIYPSKMVKSKLDKEKRDLILLSGVEKKWYTGKTLLIINDLPQPDHEVFLQMNWRELENIRLYRKVETLRNYFGPMGKNGVIEVYTKNYKASSAWITPNFLKEYQSTSPSIDDPKPRFKPLQFIGTNTANMHGDRIGKFNLFEVSKDKITLKSHYEVN